MSRGGETAVGHAVDERLAIIPRGVQADGEPEVSGAAQREAEKEADVCRRDKAAVGHFGRMWRTESVCRRLDYSGKGPGCNRAARLVRSGAARII